MDGVAFRIQLLPIHDEPSIRIVAGQVVQVTIRPKVVFLNLDQPHPNSPFTAVIFSKNTNGFGDLKALAGRQVEISGLLKEFKDKPELVITRTNQLTVITNLPTAVKE